MESDEIQFVSTQRNQQKLVYRGKCYTLKQTNRNDKCWIYASGTRGCPGKLYTNLDATQVMRTKKGDGTSGPPERTWYLPHHAVYQHNQGKTKCRLVFDGSAEWNGTSLNNCLDPGPRLQPDLVAVLLWFRRSRIAL
ncbi:hypothetical protein T08_15653 [Trichinella sp. T8]|nr:hypothetical protein T08_15653 [Trichinella sp. T8]